MGYTAWSLSGDLREPVSTTVTKLKETEAQFATWVIALARTRGWRVAHFRPARTEKGWRTPVAADGAGFPDLVLARRGEVLFAELKSNTGRLSKAQQDWDEALPALYIWRPSRRAVIEEILR